MFYIVTTICFLHLTNLPELPVCFAQGFVKYGFETKEECEVKKNNLIELIDQDLKDRQVSMILYCTTSNEIEQTDV